MARVEQTPAAGDRRDRLVGERGVLEVAPAALEAPQPDPLGDPGPLRLEEPVQVARGDEVRGGDRRGPQVGVVQAQLDRGLHLGDQVRRARPGRGPRTVRGRGRRRSRRGPRRPRDRAVAQPVADGAQERRDERPPGRRAAPRPSARTRRRRAGAAAPRAPRRRASRSAPASGPRRDARSPCRRGRRGPGRRLARPGRAPGSRRAGGSARTARGRPPRSPEACAARRDPPRPRAGPGPGRGRSCPPGPRTAGPRGARTSSEKNRRDCASDQKSRRSRVATARCRS